MAIVIVVVMVMVVVVVVVVVVEAGGEQVEGLKQVSPQSLLQICNPQYIDDGVMAQRDL